MICLFSATGIDLEDDSIRTQLYARSWNSSLFSTQKEHLVADSSAFDQSINAPNSKIYRFKLWLYFLFPVTKSLSSSLESVRNNTRLLLPFQFHLHAMKKRSITFITFHVFKAQKSLGRIIKDTNWVGSAGHRYLQSDQKANALH